MAMWHELDMETKIAAILDADSHEPGHHFGHPFLTPYQIAIRFEQQYPDEFQRIGKPVGGRGTGQRNSLAQYIALELSKRIKNERIKRIEGRFLHRDSLKCLQCEKDGQTIEASSVPSYDLSLFRLRDESLTEDASPL